MKLDSLFNGDIDLNYLSKNDLIHIIEELLYKINSNYEKLDDGQKLELINSILNEID